ncbi:helix-turn-helix domain-containing protein [Celeribacter indicus]|uniref:Transcriptional regulator n=1 Tax=Celeribacter indicus TaxID=1208324 RepID=A0A0B5DZC0_9RHOB|nr:helix-turn-helix domain-containing protein [Celeribacter indicus]AJE45562.1 transcriptional regulator [Celeribacter indicus]SDW85985.1 transcriptional regulator, AraC family [Celeribacter indicus]
MDAPGIVWYFPGMTDGTLIPHFTLFGETSAFPDVIHCERIFDRARLHDWTISPHRHSQMAQVLHIERGAARVVLDGRERPLGSGEYLYVPPQIVHGFAFTRGTEGVVLSFPSPVVARLGPESAALARWLSEPCCGPLSGEIAPLIAMLAGTYEKTGIFRAQRLVALTHMLLAALAEDSATRHPAAPAPDRQMQRLDALLATHLGEGWTARDYAGALHMTPGHLNRIVRRAAGMSLTAYLETAVMTEACRLIAFTRLPVAGVGYRLGYADPSYFSRRFRARMGETPSAYRARVAGG